MVALYWPWAIVKSVLNGIARAVVLVLLIAVVILIVALIRGDGVPANTVLELDLRSGMDDKTAAALLDLGSNRLSVMGVVLTLDRAGRDSRVKGVLVRAGSGDLALAKGEELRDAFKRFQRAGKFVIADSQTFYSA